MTLAEAYLIMDANPDISNQLLKANYRWLIWFYHPDTQIANMPAMIPKVKSAFEMIAVSRI